MRGHWGIENHLHWQLDVSFREDDCRVRTGHAAANLSVIRRFALGLLKLIFYSCASVFDVSPLLMDQESYRSNKHSATLHRIFPLKSRSIAV